MYVCMYMSLLFTSFMQTEICMKMVNDGIYVAVCVLLKLAAKEKNKMADIGGL